jgi:DNA-binding CsgD family transcriptional regulator
LPLMQRTKTGVAEISRAKDRYELQNAVASFVRALGYDTFNLQFQTRATPGSSTETAVAGESYGDLTAFLRDGRPDPSPLLEHATASQEPLCWTLSTWVDLGQHAYRDYVEASGIANGVTLPLRGESGTFGALTLLSRTEREHDKNAWNAAVIIGLVAMARAIAIAQMYGKASAEAEKYHSLNPLQREILKWIASGKTNAEIALIVGRSKRTVDYHIIQILNKLEVTSRTQAAAIFATS